MDPTRGTEDPSAVREILHELAGAYWTLRDAWEDGDRYILELLDQGWRPQTGSFERLAKGEGRESVRRVRLKLQRLLPVALPYVDPALRARLLHLLNATDPDSAKPDADGEVGVRWRHHWVETGLETDFEEVLPLLRAAGDAAVREMRQPPPLPSDGPSPPADTASPPEKPPPEKPQTLRGEALDSAAAALLLRNPDWRDADLARALLVPRQRISELQGRGFLALKAARETINAERAERHARLADIGRREGLSGASDDGDD